MKKDEPIAPTDVRYIKLGQRGAYERTCFDEQVLRIDYKNLYAFKGMEGDKLRKAICKSTEKQYASTGADKSQARQIQDFYFLGENVLWFTFSAGCLWWCFAKPGVRYRDDAKNYSDNHPDGGVRERKTLESRRWRNTNIKGQTLHMHELSGLITKTAGFQGTICDPPTPKGAKHKIKDTLVWAINGERSPTVKGLCVAFKDSTGGSVARVEELVIDLMRELNPRDFESLVDLVFSRLGWLRVSSLGGPQKTVDFIMENCCTGKRMCVQVKTETKPQAFADCENEFSHWKGEEMFYVYHTGKKPEPKCGNITVIEPKDMAKKIVKAELVDWLIKKFGGQLK